MNSFLLLSLMFALLMNSANPYGQLIPATTNPGGPLIPSCPDSNTCGRPAPLANLICYTNQQASGLNYAFIGFDDGIVAFVSINLNCQPGVVSVLDVLVVYGFMFKLTYPVWSNGTTEQSSKLWYLNLAVPGCPSIDEIVYYVYNNQNGQFNKALYPTPIEYNVAYTVYQEMIESGEYKVQCNVFQSEKVDDNCKCPSTSDKTPITRISLGEIKTAVMYSTNHSSKTNGSAFQYIHAYGINGIECPLSRTPVPGLKPALYRETCYSVGYDSSVYCKNFQNSPQLYEIARSYGYDKYLEYLDAYKACKLATLWTQGYNCRSGNNDGGYPSCPRNNPGSGSFTYIGIAIIPMATVFIYPGTPLFPQTFIILEILKGYCPISIKDAIMQYFVNAC